MGRVGYDSLQGILRLTEADGNSPDPFSVSVLTYHAALEIEVDELLSLALPHPEKLRGGGLGFKHKVSVLNAAWRGNSDAGDQIALALLAYNDLRNCVAHNDSRKAVVKHVANLVKATKAFTPGLQADPSPYMLAVHICAFMGDSTLERLTGILNELDGLVNVKMPKAFGSQDVASIHPDNVVVSDLSISRAEDQV